MAVNLRGQVIGTQVLGYNEERSRAFLWSGGHLTFLRPLPGDDRTAAYAINDLGQIAGASWKQVDLGGDADTVNATAINQAGDVIGTDVHHSGFLWSGGKTVYFKLRPRHSVESLDRLRPGLRPREGLGRHRGLPLGRREASGEPAAPPVTGRRPAGPRAGSCGPGTSRSPRPRLDFDPAACARPRDDEAVALSEWTSFVDSSGLTSQGKATRLPTRSGDGGAIALALNDGDQIEVRHGSAQFKRISTTTDLLAVVAAASRPALTIKRLLD